MEKVRLEEPDEAIKLIQDYLNNGGRFVQRAQMEMKRQFTKLDSGKWRDTKLDIAGMNPTDAIKRIQDYINSGGLLVKQANNKIKQLQDKVAGADWRKIKADAEIDPVKGLADTQAYIASRGAFLEEAKRFEKKLERRIASKDWDKARREARGKNPEDAITHLQNWAATANPTGEWKDKFDAEIRSLQSRDAKAKQSLESRRISQWKEYARGLSIEDRLKEIDRVLNDPASTQRMKDSANNLKQTALNNQRINRERAAKDAHKRFADQMLIFSGAGLGLLGPAGFPLLNIGFSAMSGGPVGAGIAAFTTAIGESIRGLNAFTQKNIEAAKSIGLVSINAKLAEAEKEAFNAVMGQGALVSQTAGLNERLRIARENGLAPVGFGASRGWTDIKEALKTQFTEFFARPFSMDRDSIFETWTKQYKASTKQAAIDIPLAYDAMQREFHKTTTKIENDPYQTWVRMQNAAFDTTKETQTELMRKQLEIAKLELDAILGIKNNTSKDAKAPIPVGGN